MIKLIIFDLDGVLVDARELHYEALNRALNSIDKKYVITRAEHLSTYDGLPTTKKLNMLTKNKGLPKDLHDEVWQKKQEMTLKIIDEEMTYDERMREILRKLRSENYIMCVASNSIRESCKMMLLRKGLLEYFDFYYSNQDVINPKPNTEMYLRCMIKAGVNPKESLIIEDSHIGRKAALDSGAYLCAVEDSSSVTYNKIKEDINMANKELETRPKWQGGNLNILIPMAGAGKRFKQAGYTFPKPLVEVKGKPMIQLVVENLNINAQHIFIVLKEHYHKYNLKHFLNLIAPGCKIVQIEGVTEGAACSTLLAEEYINNDNPLLIANSDQFVEWDSNEFMYSMIADDVDGGILTFTATHPKWSFAKLGEDGFVTEVAEKDPISDIATVGIYFWAKGSDYVKYAKKMIAKNIRVNNEFYVCPVYNEAIQEGKKIKTFHIKGMWGLGTPEDLKNFETNYKADR
ncbi:MAG: HAD-IA family hydrolase [Candidatus Hermodarchaeota archaeon]